MLTESIKTEKRALSERIERETKEFLKRGGRIQRPGVTRREPQEKLSFNQKKKQLYIQNHDKKS